MCVTMYSIVLISLLIILNIFCCDGSGIFHERTKVTFLPDGISEYFGYTVLLTDAGLIVGAPKARSRLNATISPGLVFTCRLDNLDGNNVTCLPLGADNNGRDASYNRIIAPRDFFRDDMWFGATVANVPIGKLLICAPRWANPYMNKHLLANGACYVQTKKRGLALMPLKEINRQAYMTNGARREFGEYGTHLNFYAYGQAGMSVKVTSNNSVIIGAPGLLQWAGGIIVYRYIKDQNSMFFSKQPTTNPYYEKELAPDDYFGYSVESGIFEVNGSTLYVGGAPRARSGYGQVFIFEPSFRENDPMDIRATIHGPQLGSYFGANLCCADINGDGVTDLLVGAPNFVKKDGGTPYDQGAVFVYLTRQKESGFLLENASYVFGSGESGARFGSAIADLGDVDGDGFNDVAIGAPWENNGLGAVYIYRGSETGLRKQYTQRIVAEGARSFGMSISRGFDVDNNNCSDLAIGAHRSESVYLYRCVPTIQVFASIKVPDAMDLPQNATNFTAIFCVTAPPKDLWPHVKIELKAKITVDVKENRAMISGDTEYTVVGTPGNTACDEQVVEIKPTADLSKPISLTFDLEPNELMKEDSTTFLMRAARLSEDSDLHSSFDIQIIRDCGEDLICRPWLEMTLVSLSSPYVPGTETRLGATVVVVNKEEPAYGAKVNLTLPSLPIRIPSSCTLKDLNMTCDVPAPLRRTETVVWEIELEYTSKDTAEKELKIVAELIDPLFRDAVSEGAVKELIILITPEANFSISGKALPNITVPVTREKLYAPGVVSFAHYFEVTNFGPSDWSRLEAQLYIPEVVSLSNPIKGCKESTKLNNTLDCVWSVPAKVSKPVVLQLRYDLKKYGKFFEEKTLFNITTKLLLIEQNKTAETTSELVLDPEQPIWPLIVGLVAGILVLAAIIYALYKYGFFSRQRHEELKRLQEQEQSVSEDEPVESTSCSQTLTLNGDESTRELIEDSD